MGESQTFGQWIRHHRRELDLTQVELSRRVGCAPVTIRKVEADEMRPSKQLAELLVEQLGVPVEARENLIRFARGGELVVPVAAAERRHNLPNPISSFIGRKREIHDIQGLLERSRLVTLTGVGGSGKTRLALEVAGDLVDAYQNGVWWVELAELMVDSLVPQTIAKIFGLKETPDQQTSEILENYLRNKRMLLVIDNCEHLLNACADFADQLLQACPHLGILATSREPLGVAGETVYQVSPLSLPDPEETSLKKLLQSEAVCMLVERAQAISPDFSLGEQNMAAVIQICRRLDGIPLALELAAARVRHITVEHIAERLDKRFDLLTTGSRTALPRQQTLRATMDWSFGLLSKKEKILFRRLSAFTGGFTLDTAVRVCAGSHLAADDVLPELSRLVDRSLVEVVQKGGMERYRMLDTIRAYAAGKLHESGEEERLRDRHLEYFTGWVEEVEPRMRGPEQMVWWDRMEIEHDNIRSALERSLTGEDVQLGLRLAGAAFWFWKKRNYWREGLQWLKATLARAPIQGRTSERAKVLVLACYMALDYHTGDPISPWVEEGLEIFRELGDHWWISFALLCIGWRRILMNQATSARDSFEESVSFAREAKDDWILSFALRGLGAAMERVDYELARPLLEESILHAQVAGDQWALSEGLKQLGTIALGQRDYDRVESLGKETLRLVQEIGDKQLISESFMFLGRACLGQGDTMRAQNFYEKGLPFAESVGYMEGVCEILIGLGYVAEAEGHPWRSAILLTASESFLNSISATIKSRPWDLRDYEFYLSKVKEQLGEAEFNRAMGEGRAMSLEQTIQFALEDC